MELGVFKGVFAPSRLGWFHMHPCLHWGL